MSELNSLKIQLGDICIAQKSTLSKIDSLKESHSVYENELVKKYGKDSVIDISTGEIKQQENG